MKAQTRKKLIKQVGVITRVQAQARRQQASSSAAGKERARAALREATRALDAFFGVERLD